MMDYNAPLFQHPQPIWDAKKCEKEAKRTAKDGLGTPYPFKGYIGCHPQWGVVRYNGGCEREGKWYQGENKPLPKVAEGFEIINVSTWGWRIRKIEKPTESELAPHRVDLLNSDNVKVVTDDKGNKSFKVEPTDPEIPAHWEDDRQFERR